MKAGCGYAMQYLVDRIGALGGTIIYGAKVTDITMTEGRATGLVAKGKGGETYTATAKAVLLASGGFGANQEMVDEYYPQYKGRSFNCCPASTATASCSARRSARASSAWAANLALTCLRPPKPAAAWRSPSCIRPHRASW